MDGGNLMAFPPMDASFLVDGMTGLPTPAVAPVAPVAPPMAAPVLDDPMDPSALGLSPVGPAPERPTLGGQKPDSLAQIVRLAMLGLAAGMGPGRGTGLAQGMVLADQRRQQQQLQQDRLALQDYQNARSDWEQQQRQAAQEADRRGRVLMSALSNLERDLDATKSSADAERVYQMYGAALSSQGYRGYDPESLKRKFKNPDRKARAMKVVDAYMKNPVWVKVYESDPDAALEATVDLDGVGMTMREAMQIAGSGLIGKDGKAITPRTPPKADTRSIQVRAADALARGDRGEYDRLIQLERDFSAAGRAPAGGGSAPSVGSFEDYVRRAYGANPTAQQIVQARREYGASDDKPQTPKDPTEGERKAAGFYGQMDAAIKLMDSLEGSLSESELYQIQSLPQEGLIGAINRGRLSENAKRYVRALEQFTESRLRPVSGAAIADTEYERDRRTYARQYDETPTLAADRKAARRQALSALRSMAGRAAPGEASPDALTPDPVGASALDKLNQRGAARGGRRRDGARTDTAE